MNNAFDVQSFILSLVANGGIAMVVSGWLAAKVTHWDGLLMNVQSILVAVVLTGIGSLAGLVPIAISDYWHFLQTGLANGVLASLLYKSGIFTNVLTAIGARAQSQLIQS